jgi:hypothetical protein
MVGDDVNKSNIPAIHKVIFPAMNGPASNNADIMVKKH